MSDQKDVEDLLDKLAAAIKNEEIQIFSKEEVGELRKIIEGYSMLKSWGKLGRLIIWLVLTAAAIKVGIDNLGVLK